VLKLNNPPGRHAARRPHPGRRHGAPRCL